MESPPHPVRRVVVPWYPAPPPYSSTSPSASAESESASSSSSTATAPLALPLADDLDDDYPTLTSQDQREVERRVAETLRYVVTGTVGSVRGKKSKRGGKSKLRAMFGGEMDDTDSSDDSDNENDQSPSRSPTTCPSLCELSIPSHSAFALSGLLGRIGCYPALDASRPWLVFWSLSSLDVMGEMERMVSSEVGMGCVRFLESCIERADTMAGGTGGGFGGGPGQQAHTAPTYASVMSLAILTGHPDQTVADAAMDVIRRVRRGIYDFYMRCKVILALRPGAASTASAAAQIQASSRFRGRILRSAFRVASSSEVDTRGAYTVISVASLLGILTPDLAEGVPEWIAQCQTYEGGLGGEPGNEAHGGYTFCGLAASVLLGSVHLLDTHRMIKWATQRQRAREGGFQGRTNKLVDGCYSYWVGALFPILHSILLYANKVQATGSSNHTPGATSSSSSSSPSSSSAQATTPATSSDHSAPSNTSSTSDSTSSSSHSATSSSLPLPSSWLFDSLALQRYVVVSCQAAQGGLRDKPGKYPDLYHTCYCLAGLSVAQHGPTIESAPLLGREKNLLADAHPIYNIKDAHVERVQAAMAKEPPIDSATTSEAGTTAQQ